MQLLTDYNSIKQDEWHDLIAKSSVATWFQTQQAYDFFYSQPELFTTFVLGITNTDDSTGKQRLRGVCVGYVTVEKNKLKQFFTRRAIIIGGPLLANDATNEEVEFLLSNLNRRLRSKAIYVETRNFNDYSKWRLAFENAGFEYQPHLNFHIDTFSLETVDANLGKSRKRDIRTTIREGVNIISNPTEEQVKEYYSILNNLYTTRVKTPLFPLSFFYALNRHPAGRFLLTEYKGHIIGGTVCVELQGKCLYEWFVCGEDCVYPHVFPSCFATYSGIKYAAEHDCPRFDMMGAGTPKETYGVRDFKAKFGGTLVEYGRFKRINQQLLYKIGEIGVSMMRKI